MGLTFLDLKDIAERESELINPTSPGKILEIGRLAGMSSGQRLVDFGCGYAEPLVLWAEEFGITGVGVDLRPRAVERARLKIAERGLAGQLRVFEGEGAEFPHEPGSFDYATCIGASFVWENLDEALQALRRAIKSGGKVLLGEVFWLKDAVPPDLVSAQPAIHSQGWLLEAFRRNALDVEYVLHSNLDEWDRYEASNWRGLLRWIEENPSHADLQDVVRHLHESQDEYFRFGREYFGWALFLLNPVRYPQGK